MVKVSVVIPTYNRANIITKAIDSALNQTLSNIEVIVVDDASVDETSSVLESYSNQIQHYRHDTNKGGSAARNTGIEAASGDYIAFLDSDDTWDPTKLEKQVELLERRNSQWIAAYCGFEQKRPSRIVELVDEHFPRKTGLEGGEELIVDILMRRFAHGGSSTLLVDRLTVEGIDGFDERFQRHQDVEFLIRLLQRGKIAYVDEPLVYKHDTGNPSIDDVKNSRELFLTKFESLIQEIEQTGENVTGVQEFRLAKHYYAVGEFKKGTAHLRQGTCPHPRDYLGLLRAMWLGGIRVVR